MKEISSETKPAQKPKQQGKAMKPQNDYREVKPNF
jgi:hypothetical protein